MKKQKKKNTGIKEGDIERQNHMKKRIEDLLEDIEKRVQTMELLKYVVLTAFRNDQMSLIKYLRDRKEHFEIYNRELVEMISWKESRKSD